MSQSTAMGSAWFDSTVPLSDGSVFTRRWRSDRPEQPPIVLLHDSLGCVGLWRDFPEALAQATARDVIAYDRLGFGQSSARPTLPSVNFITEEAETVFPAVQRAHRLERFVLFGHSVGAAMALTIAAATTTGCQAVISVSAQAFVEARTLTGIRAAKERFTHPTERQRLARWHGDKAQWVLDAWTEVWLSPGFRSWSLEPILPRVACPVLVIHGDTDEYGSNAFPRRIAAGVGGQAEMAILEGCGHVPHRERQDEVLRLTAGFLQRHVT